MDRGKEGGSNVVSWTDVDRWKEVEREGGERGRNGWKKTIRR